MSANKKNLLQKSGSEDGFTLIELLVVISIMIIILTVVIFNHQQFNSRVEITNLSYEVALAIREAQVFGLAVYGEGETGFNSGYGVHFDLNESEGSSAFILFSDPLDGDGLYDGDFSCSTDCMYKFTIGGGNQIDCLGGKDNNGNLEACGNVDRADLVFYRPDPDAKINLDGDEDARELFICFTSPEGDKGRVIVSDTGQISVEGPENCPA